MPFIPLESQYPDGVSYLISFNWGNSTIGAFSIEDTVDTSSWKAHVIVSPDNPGMVDYDLTVIGYNF